MATSSWILIGADGSNRAVFNEVENVQHIDDSVGLLGLSDSDNEGIAVIHLAPGERLIRNRETA